MTLSAHVIQIVELIASTMMTKLPPETKPELGCAFADLRRSERQTAGDSESRSQKLPGWDQMVDGACELQFVPSRETGRLKLES